MVMGLTKTDLLREWRGSVDPEYGRALTEKGEGHGLEVYAQLAAQLERVSLSSEVSSQSLYVTEWSGQTAPPAGEARYATGSVTITRTKATEVPLVLQAGLILLDQTEDWSADGTAIVATGRKYYATTAGVLPPSEMGPIELPIVATLSGHGGNGALPGGIRAIDQLGRVLAGAEASVVPGEALHRLVGSSRPDSPVFGLVGQYVQFTGGSNTGRVLRVVGFEQGAFPSLGTALLAATTSVLISGSAGTFTPGEEVTQGALRYTFLGISGDRLVLDRVSGSGELAAGLVVGTMSGAIATVTTVDVPASLFAETATAEWRSLDWSTDLGVEVSNEASPTGGTADVLGEIGRERKVYRSPGEDLETFRQRVNSLPDVVSPRAVRRAVNRVLAPFGMTACHREVGMAKFRGLFFDGDPSNPSGDVAFAFDMDFDVQPRDRWKVLLDYTEFRAFAMVGVPPSDLGEFGIAFDDGPHNAFDAAPALAFFDGYPVTAASIYGAVWAAVETTKAAGVGFDLYLEDEGCV
jgi:hypothetical protein